MSLSQRARSLQPSPTLAITAKANEMNALVGKTLHGKTVKDSDDLCGVLIEKARVAAVPGTGFGDPSRLRFSFATSEDNIREGLNRIAECMQKAK